MIDLGFIGNRFTWNYGVELESRKSARLDKAVGCGEWRQLFPAVTVRQLVHAHSDHCPIMLLLDDIKATRLRERPFRFQVAWMLHKDYFSWMEEWPCNGDLVGALKRFQLKLVAWNRDTFGRILKRKK